MTPPSSATVIVPSGPLDRTSPAAPGTKPVLVEVHERLAIRLQLFGYTLQADAITWL